VTGLRKRRVVVVLKSDNSIKGVLWGLGPRWVVLKDAAQLQGRQETPVDGEVVIERRNVDYFQVLP
jgi:small nuclear ribonucleoprotein (snRNP)-like protein